MPNGRKLAAAKDVEQTIGLLFDDAIVPPPNATGAATKEAIRNVWKNMFASPASSSLATDQSAVANPARWRGVRGRYELTMNDASGKPIDDRGKITSRSGKNKLMEIGNVPPTCEFRSRSVGARQPPEKN